MRHFNTSGPVRPEHYQIPPLSRIALPETLDLVERAKYFVLHAPRQSGKTSVLRALRDDLNRRRYRAVYCNVEAARAAGDDVDRGMRTVLSEISDRAQETLQDDFLERHWPRVLDVSGPVAVLNRVLARWATASPEPLVLLIDEIDSLRGEMLLAVLSQLRAGYDKRPTHFPLSVLLCGVRNAVDYPIPTGSPFNIVDRSLRLGDFPEAEVRDLLGQHTEETGQAFTEDAQAEVWAATRGQPWLVNALAEQSCFETESGRDRSRAITDDDIAAARERLILRRPTHFRHIADRLDEPRVRRVIDPILAGRNHVESIPRDDRHYVRDLGLTASDGNLEIANPIYREVIPRILASSAEVRMRHDSASYRRLDGGLQVSKILAGFQQFFRENADWWSNESAYRESAAQVLLQAYLHRVVNAGGQIAREYGLGRDRTDLRISWKRNGGNQIFVIECKVRRSRDGLETLIADGIRQTARYAAGCGAEEGHLVVFDQDPTRSWDEKIFRREARMRKSPDGAAWDILDAEAEPGDRLIFVWGM